MGSTGSGRVNVPPARRCPRAHQPLARYDEPQGVADSPLTGPAFSLDSCDFPRSGPFVFYRLRRPFSTHGAFVTARVQPMGLLGTLIQKATRLCALHGD